MEAEAGRMWPQAKTTGDTGVGRGRQDPPLQAAGGLALTSGCRPPDPKRTNFRCLKPLGCGTRPQWPQTTVRCYKRWSSSAWGPLGSRSFISLCRHREGPPGWCTVSPASLSLNTNTGSVRSPAFPGRGRGWGPEPQQLGKVPWRASFCLEGRRTGESLSCWDPY